jgi:integrase
MRAQKRARYSLYKKRIGDRDWWYARYWDEHQKRYAAHRATGVEAIGKKGRRAEAEQAALEMFPEICFNSCRVTMLEYLASFWKVDSPYFKEAELVRGRRLSASHAKSHAAVVRLHVAPYPGFASLGLGKLTAALIRDWRLWLAERGVSGGRINRAMQAIRVPLRYAMTRGEVPRDPFALVKLAHETKTEKGVLTPQEAAALLASPPKDLRRRLAILLGALCGMRIGEVRGLHWEDLDPEEGIVHVRHNWQDLEGIKPPKNGEPRDVPLPRAVREAGEAYQAGMSGQAGPLVFGRKDGKPLCNGYFRLGLIADLEAIGISAEEQRRRNISFHSLRHTFVTLSRALGVSDFEIQALAGHKSAAMMERYSHARQVVDYDSARRRIDGFSSALKPPGLIGQG